MPHHHRSALLLGSLVACSNAAPLAVGSRAAEIVYGADGREALSALPSDSPLRERARSVAAVIPKALLQPRADGSYVVDAPSAAAALDLCPDQRFGAQPYAATCTAFLVDTNLLMSAGHCFTTDLDCQNYRFVFDYALAEDGELPSLAPESVFECRRSMVRENDLAQAPRMPDYTVIELTRPVATRTPLVVRAEPARIGEAVSVISASGGVPLTVDRGAHVLDVPEGADYFALDADTAHGASGAPVFDADGAVLGLHARGNTDLTRDRELDCQRVREVPTPPPAASGEKSEGLGTDDLYAEEASFAAPVLDVLCARAYPSPALCDAAAQCGDEHCTGDETHAQCPVDCAEEPVRLHASDSPSGGCNVAPSTHMTQPSFVTIALALILTRARRRHRASS